jgi:hypothetical protein
LVLPLVKVLLVDERQVLEQIDVVALNNEDCAAYLDDVVDLKRVQLTDFALSTQSQPSAVCWANILKIESCLLVRVSLAIKVSYFGMKVAHLGVFLDVKAVLHISSDTQPLIGINSDHSASSRTFENMQLDYALFACGHDPEFAESHLEHHVFPQKNFLAHHYKASSCRPNVSDEKLGCHRLFGIGVIGTVLVVLDFTVPSAHEAFAYHDVVARWMSSQSCAVFTNYVDVVEKLAFYSFEHKNVLISEVEVVSERWVDNVSLFDHINSWRLRIIHAGVRLDVPLFIFSLLLRKVCLDLVMRVLIAHNQVVWYSVLLCGNLWLAWSRLNRLIEGLNTLVLLDLLLAAELIVLLDWLPIARILNVCVLLHGLSWLHLLLLDACLTLHLELSLLVLKLRSLVGLLVLLNLERRDCVQVVQEWVLALFLLANIIYRVAGLGNEAWSWLVHEVLLRRVVLRLHHLVWVRVTVLVGKALDRRWRWLINGASDRLESLYSFNNFNPVQPHLDVHVALEVLVSNEVKHRPIKGKLLKVGFVLGKLKMVFEPENGVVSVPLVVLLSWDKGFDPAGVFHLIWM